MKSSGTKFKPLLASRTVLEVHVALHGCSCEGRGSGGGEGDLAGALDHHKVVLKLLSYVLCTRGSAISR